MKTIKFNIAINEHDFLRKTNQAVNFLKKKQQVKITVNLRGREKYYAERGINLLNKAHNILKEYGKPTGKPTEKNLNIVYNPIKNN